MSWDRTIDDALKEGELILDAIKQVRDPDIDASEYDFIDDLDSMHPAPAKKGNDGLASMVPYLATFTDGEEVLLDEGLIELADRELTEEHDSRYQRKRINNIARDSRGRSGSKESLGENEVNGHGRLLEVVEDLYKEAGETEVLKKLYKDKGLLLERDNIGGMSVEEFRKSYEVVDREGYEDGDFPPGITVWEPEENDTISSKPENNQHNKGGDNEMGRIDDVQDTYEDALDAGKSELEAQADALEYANEKYNEAEEALSAVQTAVTDLQIDAAHESGELYRQIGQSEGLRDAVEQNLSDTEDSIEHMKNDLL